jgi:hypothetical protein
MDVAEERVYKFNGSFTFAYQEINKIPDTSKK